MLHFPARVSEGADAFREARPKGPAASQAARVRKVLSTLSPPDRLALIWLVFFGVLAAARVSHPLALMSWMAAAIAVIGSVAAWGARSRTGRLVHDFLPIPTILAVFSLAGPVVAAANPTRWDGRLAALDARLWGPLVTAWRGALGRPAWLTDTASLAYVSFYFVPAAIAVALYRAQRRREFDSFVFSVMTAFFLPYLGYLLFPALGPRVPDATEAATLGGGVVSAAVRAVLRVMEVNRLDAFPSGHTAVSLVVLFFGVRLLPRWTVPLVANVAAILFATVYLSLHYVVDLAAGALVAALVPLVLPILGRACGRAPQLRRGVGER